MIDKNKLTEDDIGKYVEYNNGYKQEKGRIKSWNENVIFVVYNCAGEWENYKDYTAAGTKPEDLKFI